MYWMVTLGLFDTLDRTYPVSTERDIYKLMHFSIPTLSGVFPVDKHFFHSAAPQYWWSKFFTSCSEANKCPAIQRPGPSFWRSGYWSQEVRSFLGHYCYKRFISWCCGETLSINRNYLTCLQIVKDYILISWGQIFNRFSFKIAFSLELLFLCLSGDSFPGSNGSRATW